MKVMNRFRTWATLVMALVAMVVHAEQGQPLREQDKLSYAISASMVGGRGMTVARE